MDNELLKENNMNNKELLIKDLCERLPYNTITKATDWCAADCELKYGHIERFKYNEIELKPYLRSLKDMTEDEILELYKIAYTTWYSDSLYYKNEEFISFRDSIQNNTLCFKSSVWMSDINKVYDWLNANHFDFRGLIPMDLAIEVTKENNPYED